MSAPVPTRLGRYEILFSIGKGGMGEVFKARDPQLNRDVAIKVSAQQFTDRFEREARAIAALNHKNICTLYDIGPNYLVMEFVEGPTLAERIAEGPIPLEEALGIAKQIAAALESAHEKPIVHRDLKPANIKIKPDGEVKVLDFGLAKSGGQTELTSDSPTLLTVAGMILGTAGYMAPEQARGKEADKRADIWAFGVVFYEMLTGKRLFAGETVGDTLASVIKDEPDWTKVPTKVQRLLRRCLEKDPKRRLRDITGAEFLLEDVGPAATTRSSRLPWAVAGMVALLAAALASVHFRERPPETPVTRLSILPPEKVSFRFGVAPQGVPALSPDGRRLVFGAQSADGATQRLWIRSLDSMTAQPLAGTEGATFSYPFWSPDARSIGFSANGKLKKIDLSGGPAVTLADATNFRGASWSPRGVILFAPISLGPLLRIPASGGKAAAATLLDPARKETSHRWPWFLPDGRHFLYAAVVNGTTDATIYVGSLDSRESRIVAQANSNAVYASGYLLFLRDNTLMAQPFDAKSLTTAGEAVPVAEQIAEDPARARGVFAFSDNGALIFQSGVLAERTLAWLDRTGKRLATVGEPVQFGRTFLSPDGKRAAVSVYDSSAHNYDLWTYDLMRNLRSRFTFDPANDNDGIWSPDGSQIVFSSDRKGHRDLYRKLASGAGAEELLYADGLEKQPTSWSPDGKFLTYYASGTKTGYDLWILPLEGERKPFPFLMTGSNETSGQFSPDGHWIAYQSDESGRYEIYIAPFPGAGGKRQVSVAGGQYPRWRADGKELFYAGLDGRLMAAEVGLKGAEVEIGAVRPLFETQLGGNGNGYQYDVSADGQRFLAVTPSQQGTSEPLTLVQNWTAGLKK